MKEIKQCERYQSTTNDPRIDIYNFLPSKGHETYSRKLFVIYKQRCPKFNESTMPRISPTPNNDRLLF